MKKPIVVLLAAFLMLLACSFRPRPKTISVPRGVAQLFIDDELVASQENLVRTLHQPVKDNGGDFPVLALEDEFGKYAGTLEANGTIVYDPRIRKYVMFAMGYSSQYRMAENRPWDAARLYRFTSSDGFHWVKGDDGTPQWVFPRTRQELYDPKSDAYASNLDFFSCYYDSSDEQYPYKAWMYLQKLPADREGLYYYESSDGINWKRGPQVAVGYGDYGYCVIHQNGRTLVGPADVSLFYYDSVENRFLGIFKFYSPKPVAYGNKLRSRAYVFLPPPLSRRFDVKQIKRVQLMPPAAQKGNDGPYDEYYSSNGWRYESMWLGGLKIWHRRGDYPWSANGCAYLKLIRSRDGLEWSKVPFPNEDGYPEVFIPNGPEGGNGGRNDGGYVTQFSQGPFRMGDELIFYYGCSSYGKNSPKSLRVSGGGIFIARLRIDGFVSVDAGTLTTWPLSFEGEDLFLNAVGPVTVQALDGGGKIVGSQRVEGDSIRHKVLFDGKSLRETVRGHVVRLRFTIGKGGKLYSFTIR